MVKNYLKTALRNITKYKGYSTINILGLAIGMTCCLLIMLWVFDELSFDKFHENDDKIYRVEQDQSYGAGLYHVVVTPIPLVPYLIDEIPEIVDATRYISIGGINIKYEDKNNLEYGIRAVDPAFLNIFTFPLEKGEKNTVLDDPYSIVISKEIAEKYFGDENPVGKILNFNNGHDLTVRGILGETKKNSFLQFDMLVSCEFIKRINLFDYYNDWGNAIQSYVLLNENGQIGDVDEKITIVRHNHTSPEEERLSFEEADKYESYPKFNLMKFSDIHLYGYSGFEKTMGFVKYVYIFSLIAIFVLLIACINFMNLSTARSAGRAKEIGMRKVSGAVRRNIVGQFYSETILQSVFAVSIAVFLTILILPVFNSISGKELSLSYLGNWQFITGLVCVVIITGIISGSYPALFLSSFQPAQVLKGTYQSGLRGSAFRKTLVITQFTISVFLIIGTMIIYRQIDFMKTRDLGFNKNNLLYISMRSDTRKYFPTFKNELLKDTNIKGVTSGRLLPWRIGSNSGGARWQGKNPKETVLISFLKSGYDLCSTMGIDILSGREFSRDFSSDTSSAFLINEKLARIMGFRSPVGKRLSFLGVDGEIIGVMKDFHFLSLKREIGPLAIVLDPGLIRYAVIRINPENTSETLEYIEETWNNITSGYPFRYQFVEDNMANTYNIEERLGNILKYFTIIAVLIACLGLLGLASFTVEQRKKEIGIRKVLGASELKLIYIVCSEFFWLVLFSNLIAWPLSWLVMNNWIQEFAYRTDLGIEIFLLTGCIALVIALLTVSNQAVKAAFSDPAKTLKHE